MFAGNALLTVLRCKPVLPMRKAPIRPATYLLVRRGDRAARRDERMRAAVEKGPGECRRELKERQKKDKGKELHPSKVRDTICCSECGRPRCIFAKTKPTDALLRKLDAYFENVNYTCGDPLFVFPDGLEGSEK